MNIVDFCLNGPKCKTANASRNLLLFIPIIVICGYGIVSAQPNAKETGCKLSNETMNRHKSLAKTLVPSNFKMGLELGDHACGPRLSWMDEMRALGVKQASFDFVFRSKSDSGTLQLKNVRFLTEYYNYDRPVNESQLAAIRKTGLDERLRLVAESRVALSVARDREESKFKCAEYSDELLDDETLPSVQWMTNLDSPSCGKDK